MFKYKKVYSKALHVFKQRENNISVLMKQTLFSLGVQFQKWTEER